MYRVLIIICTLVLVLAIIAAYFLSATPNQSDYMDKEEKTTEEIEKGIHKATGLIANEGFRETITHCTACHSADIIIQNRLDRDAWIETIRWMQRTQNLWDLGADEAIIVNYLISNYPPPDKGRRENLKNVEWYELK